MIKRNLNKIHILHVNLKFNSWNNPEKLSLWGQGSSKERLTSIVPRAGARITTRTIPTWTSTTRAPTVFDRRATDAWLFALAAISRVMWTGTWTARRRCAGSTFLARRCTILIRFTLGFRVEIFAVTMTQLALLSAQFQRQFAHFFFAFLLLLHDAFGSLRLSFLIGFVCSKCAKRILMNLRNRKNIHQLTLLVQQQLHFLFQLLPRIADWWSTNRWLWHSNLAREVEEKQIYICGCDETTKQGKKSAISNWANKRTKNKFWKEKENNKLRCVTSKGLQMDPNPKLDPTPSLSTPRNIFVFIHARPLIFLTDFELCRSIESFYFCDIVGGTETRRKQKGCIWSSLRNADLESLTHLWFESVFLSSSSLSLSTLSDELLSSSFRLP